MVSGSAKAAIVGIARGLALTLVGGSAAADEMVLRDPKDTRGRLDIRRVSHGHHGDDAVTHTITMHRRFPSRLLRGGGSVGGLLHLQMLPDVGSGGPRWERFVDVRWHKGRLRARIYAIHPRRGTVRRIGTGRASRPDRRTVKVRIGLRHLGELGDPPRYLWYVESEFWNRGTCKNWCWDFAPRGGSVLHELAPPEQPPEGELTAAGVNGNLPASGGSLELQRRW